MGNTDLEGSKNHAYLMNKNTEAQGGQARRLSHLNIFRPRQPSITRNSVGLNVGKATVERFLSRVIFQAGAVP